MKRPLLPLIAMAVSLSVAAQTQWLDLTGGSIVSELIGTDSYYDTRYDGNTLIVRYSLSAVAMEECPEYPGTYTLNIDGFADNHTLGEPALPYIHDIFNIGASSDCSVEVLSATYRDYDIAVAPAYGDVYQYEQQRPIQPITATDLATEPIVKKAVMPINQSYLVDIKVNPVLYLSPTRVRVYDTIKYRITSDDTISNDLMAETKRYVDFGSPTSDDNSGIMPMSYPVNPYSPTGLYVENYVIVTTPKFESALTEFVNWKRTLGFNTSVICSPGEVWQSYDEVKAAVDAAHAKKGGIDYLLIVGDGDNVPGKAYKKCSLQKKDAPEGSKYAFDVYTDLYYANPNDNLLTTTSYGRIPASSSEEITVVLNKIIRYECSPPISSSFYNNALHVSSLELYLREEPIEWSEVCLANNSQIGKLNIERRYFRDIEFYNDSIYEESIFTNLPKVESCLLDNQYYEMSDSKSKLSSHEIANSTINEAINDGVLYVGYFGHGETNRWLYPNYSISHIKSLENGPYLPVIFAPSCLTGRYHFSADEKLFSNCDDYEGCIAKEFLIAKNGGCVAYFGATDKLYYETGSTFIYSIFNAIWPNGILSDRYISNNIQYIEKPVLRLGKAFNASKYMHMTVQGSYVWPNYYASIHCFGDPSMRMYTSKPEPIRGISVKQARNNGLYILNVSSANGEEYILKNNRTNEVYKCDGDLVDITSEIDFSDYTLCITGDNRVPFVANVGELLKNNKNLCGNISRAVYSKITSWVTVDHTVDQSKNGAPITKVSINVHDLAGNLLGSSSATTQMGRTNVRVTSNCDILIVSLLVNDVVVDSKCITIN